MSPMTVTVHLNLKMELKLLCGTGASKHVEVTELSLALHW